MDSRDRTDLPLEEHADLYDDDWVPPEMFGPTRTADDAAAEHAADAVAPLDPADYFEPATAAHATRDNDLVLPQMSELWPNDAAPDSSAQPSADPDSNRGHQAASAPLADPLAASMLQTAEAFATTVPQPSELPAAAPLQHAEPLTAIPQKPAESIATPLPPAEPLTATRSTLESVVKPPAATGEPSAFRPWMAETVVSEKSAPVQPQAPVLPPPPNIPVKTLPLAPPIPPLRYVPPAPPSPPRSPEPPAAAEPPARRPVPPAPPAASAPTRRIPEPQPSAPPPRVQPPEPRTARPPRQAVASSQPPAESVEPLAAVKRSLSVLEKLLTLTASRGAGTLYLAANARPTIRVHGEVHVLDGPPVLSRHDVETLLRSLMLAQNPDALPTGAGAEWCFDLPSVGRVRCMTFRDHRGPGAVFRIGPRRAIAAEQLGLSVEIQSLALERDGLVLVAGQRSSGKGAVIAGLLDLINRTRRAYVITVEREVNVSPERDGSFISQREARGGLEEMLAVARAALRENPDVLVLQELRSAPLVNLAFDAAASGQLVIAGFTAPSAGGAIDRIVKLYPRESARAVQLLLAQHLRAVVSQVLVPKIGGGRVAAREVLLNTSAVAGALADGKAWEVPGAIEAGRKHGMVPFSDALAALVHSGSVAPDEAYRHAPDRAGFVEALKRHGIDPSSAVRFS